MCGRGAVQPYRIGELIAKSQVVAQKKEPADYGKCIYKDEAVKLEYYAESRGSQKTNTSSVLSIS